MQNINQKAFFELMLIMFRLINNLGRSREYNIVKAKAIIGIKINAISNEQPKSPCEALKQLLKVNNSASISAAIKPDISDKIGITKPAITITRNVLLGFMVFALGFLSFEDGLV